MSVRTSIYDFFAYAIPGGLYLIAVFLGTLMMGYDVNSEKLFKADFMTLLVLVLTSYVIGHVTSKINNRWAKFFEPRPIPKLAFEEFKKLHPTVQTDINPDDWQIWFASIRRESMELTLEVDKQMATSYFLRGVSTFFAVILLLVVGGVIASKLEWWVIFSVVLLVFFSYIAVKESIKFNKRFYFLIFELVASRQKPFSFEKQN